MWKTPAAPSAAARIEAGSVTSPSTRRTRPDPTASARFSSRGRESNTTTSPAPFASRASTTCEPMNPDPPVTRKVLPLMSILGGRRLGGETPADSRGPRLPGPEFIGRDVRGYPPGVCGIGGMTGAVDEALLQPDGRGDGQARARRQRSLDDETASASWPRRLAIIDLDERSNQPMHLGGLHLVFNGEIYNYRELREELRGSRARVRHRGRRRGAAARLVAVGRGRARPRSTGCSPSRSGTSGTRSLSLATDPFGEKPLYCGAERRAT